MTLVVVRLHGLPEVGTDPLTQLDSLLEVCIRHGVMTFKDYDLEDYRWATGSCQDWKDALGLLRTDTTETPNESFTAKRGKHLRNWLKLTLSQLPQNAKLVILAYSAGGAAFYWWVCKEADDVEISRIAMAIVIAAPHSFPGPLYLEQYPEHPIPVIGEPKVDVEEIADRLTAGNVQIRVLLGECDITIPTQYEIFPDYLGVDQEIIPCANHLTICEHPRAIEKVEGWINQA